MTAPTRSDWLRTAKAPFFTACVLALVLFAGTYANSLRNAFHFDDSHVIEQNLYIRSLANIPRFFADANTFSALPQNATYRPVVSTSLAVDYAIAGGLNPTPYHVQQLLLLIALGVASYFLLLKLFATTGPQPWHRWAALFAVTLYAVHTGNSQVGNYISSRSESLAALGVVGAFLVYLYAPSTRRSYLYLLPMIIGALAKNHAIVFAPLLLAYKLFFEEGLSLKEICTPREWKRVGRVVLVTLPAFILAAVLFKFVEGMNPEGQTYGGGNRLLYLFTSAWVWVRYVAMYFVPMGLTADTDLSLFTGFDLRSLVGFAVLAASLVLIGLTSRTPRWRLVAFGVVWFWIGIAPTSTIFPLAEVTNDHRPFLGFIGLNAAVVYAVWTWATGVLERRAGQPGVRLAFGALAVLVLVGHSAGTFQRNQVWRNDASLWADVVQKSPNNGRAWMNYGLTKMRQGAYPEAKAMFETARALTPNYSYVYTNLGIVTTAMGDTAGADAYFVRAIQLDERQPAVHLFYGRYLVNAGRGPEAIAEVRRSMELSDRRLDTRQLLMSLYAAKGDTAALRALARETVALAPDDGISRVYADGGIPLAPESNDFAGWFRLGFARTQARQHVEAAQAYRMALAQDPTRSNALSNLGWTLGVLGFFEEAVPPLEQAVRLDPRNAQARANLAWVRGRAAAQGAR